MSKTYIPYYNYARRRWEVDFPDRHSAGGNIFKVASEYTGERFRYHYNCDGKTACKSDLQELLSSITKDSTCLHKVDIEGYEEEYSQQEIRTITSLIDKIEKTLEPYDIPALIDNINKETLKPVFNIDFSEEETELTGSRLGGAPFWKKGKKYPEVNGTPLSLLAQINFKELPENDIFPDKGILQFFILPDDMYGMEEGYKVIFHEDEDDWEEIAFLPAENTPVLKEGKMLFTFSQEPVSIEDECFRQYNKIFPPELESVIDDILYDNINSGTGSKLLGYPYFTQGNPELEPKYDTLLFQLDSDYEFLNWGDSGVGNFFINSKKLKKKDFSDVIYTWDCC